MTSRVPEPGSDLEADGIPETGATLPSKEVTGDAQEGFEPPGDIQTDSDDYTGRAVGTHVDDFGTTAREMHDGEPISSRVEAEEPDVLTDSAVAAGADEREGTDDPFPAGDAPDRVGRLVEPDEGASADTEADAVARDAGADLGGLTAEESAMHAEPEV